MKIKLIIIIVCGFLSISSSVVLAKNENQVQYEEKNLILDSDLDGLTDSGEKQIYKTDPMNHDSDGDGFLDGVEVLKNTDPLNNIYPAAIRTIDTREELMLKEIPWAWYFSRASGLVAYGLLWLVMFFGLAIRIPILNNRISPIFSLETHRWLSIQALFFVFFHGLVLLGDAYLHLGIMDILIPFYNQENVEKLVGGIIGLYLMIILIISSYLKKFINQKFWRYVHFLNIPLFVIITGHAFHAGTDLQSLGWLRIIFLGMSLIIALLVAVNLGIKIKNKFA